MTQPIQDQSIITSLTLGRNTHELRKGDRFLDNGICVQLLKESPMKVRFGAKDTMILTQSDIKHIETFTQINHEQHEFLCHGVKCRVYSIISAVDP